MKKLLWLVALLVGGGGAGGAYWHAHEPKPQTTYYGVTIGDSKATVQYEIGGPDMVSASNAVFYSPDYLLPQNANFNAFPNWDYAGPSLPDSGVEVHFGSKSVLADAIVCSTVPFVEVSPCPPVLGIGFNDPESKVLAKLGQPDTSMVGNGSKAMIYRRLHVTFILYLKKVDAIEVGDAVPNLGP